MGRVGGILLLPLFAGCAAIFGFDELSDATDAPDASAADAALDSPADAALDSPAHEPCRVTDFLCTDFADDSSLDEWSIDPGEGSVLADRGLSLYVPGKNSGEEVSARWDAPKAWLPEDNLHFEVTFAIPTRPGNGEMLGGPVTLFLTGSDANPSPILNVQLYEDGTTRLKFDQGLGPDNTPPAVLESSAMTAGPWHTLVLDLRALGGGYRIVWDGAKYEGILARTPIPPGAYWLQFSLSMTSADPTELKIARTVLRASE